MSTLVPVQQDMILHAFAIDGPDAGRRLAPDEVPEFLLEDTLAWVHLRAQHADTPAWIVENLSYLDPTIIDALVAEETRPRVTPVGDGLIVILRGINTIEGEAPEDMVSVRMWIDPHRIVSLAMRQVKAVEDISDSLDRGGGPRDAAEFLVMLTERLTYRIEAFWRELDDKADDLEEEVLDEVRPEMTGRLVDLRRTAIILRRYLQPQRDAMRTLQMVHPDWVEGDDLRQLAEELDALERVVEDADALRDRMALVRDEVQSARDERLNRNLYLLSILSAVFLPLGFLTGLFGINLAGMPGAHAPWAFWVFSGALCVIGALQLAILRRLRWI
ncbi:zinc transporter ZntB [Sagittula stellata]|uniref:Mg2+ and Co2+ transporters n=1 Tax=Sagittula stellata (strain ATCC 700073 / DSM 11524 / E-37) TaxID=388399 RepID=A3K962_SAGS3|nr:zinc transporter ZntB [Sagittula stellata]EBA06234.1 Mg2+ and Co2+ transporters [Sagittula stellata E-37]